MTILTTMVATMAFVAPPPQSQYAEYEKDLVPVGQKIPDMTIMTSTGTEIKLRETFKKNKATILNFFFYN